MFAQDNDQDSFVEKGVKVDSRELTPDEIKFLNFGLQTHIATSVATDLPYPQYSSNRFHAISNNLASLVRQGPIRVLVTLKSNLSGNASFSDHANNAISRTNELKQSLAGSSAKVLKEFEAFPIVLVEVDAQSIELLSIDAVAGVELDMTLELHHASSIPLIDALELHLHSTTGAGFEGGGGSWGVAIMDNGLRISHQAMTGRVISEACFVSDNSCPNGSNTMIGAGASSDCGLAGGRCEHGTHVTGSSAGAFTGSGLLAANGVAPGADIHSIQVFDAAGNSSYTVDLLEGLQYVNTKVLNGSRIASVNISLGSSMFTGNCDFVSPSVVTASSILRNNGVLIVAAAGNESSTTEMSFPACLSPIIAVGNTTDTDTVASSSSASIELDLWAPGTDITSSAEYSDTALIAFTGTSMAAPHVSGAIAMLRECYVSPGSSAASGTLGDVILNHILSSGVSVTDQRPGGVFTRPRLNVGAAALAIRPNDLFSQAYAIGLANGSFIGLNTCATYEPLEPNHFSATTGSVWFNFTAPSSGTYTFTTCDAATSFDTVLAAYTGNTVSSLVQLDANDDACGLQSSVSFNAVNEQMIRVAVSGYGNSDEFGSTGVFKLNWSYLPPMTCNGLVPTIVGTDFSETIVGTNDDDVIVGLGGDDTIDGLSGNDTICGGFGSDIIYAGAGNDWVNGESGADTISGNQDNDVIYGGAGEDYIRGSKGDDTIFGDEDNDVLDGGWGNDVIKGGPGNDEVIGGLGDDVMRGSRGNDSLDGGEGNDQLSGGEGDDYLKGGPGSDLLQGDIGNDTLRGSRGDDTLDGGLGNDSLHGGMEDIQDSCYVDLTDTTGSVACEVLLP